MSNTMGLPPHYIAKKEMIEINGQTTTKVEYPIYLVNAFSLNMIEGPVELQVLPLHKEETTDFLKNRKFISAIGHKEMADILTNELGLEVIHNRITIKLGKNDIAIVAQYTGPRLEEGATRLPEGSQIRYYLVRKREAL